MSGAVSCSGGVRWLVSREYAGWLTVFRLSLCGRWTAQLNPDDLFDPQTNIELGSFYLTELSRLFPQKLSASIASYNAGPHIVRDWVEGDGRPDDEWVESIPYAQTRSYVKRVMRSLQAYQLLY